MTEHTIQLFGLKFSINPVAFTIPGINWEVRWYGIIIAIGFLLALVYCFWRAKKFEIDSDKLIDCILVTAPAAVLCARAYYIIFHEDTPFSSFFKIHNGGLAILGGVIGAVIVGTIMCKIKKLNILSTLDLTAMGFLIGQGIGRWGNFFNQEAYGTYTNSTWFGMTGDKIASEMGEGLLVHPCFLYESIWCLLGFLLLHILSNKRKFNSELACIYLIWYGIGRAVIEGLRTDSLYIGVMRVSQLLSILMVIAGIILLVVGLIKSKNKQNDMNYVPVFNDNSENEVIINNNTTEDE